MQLVTKKHVEISIKPINENETLLTFEPDDWDDVFKYLNDEWGSMKLYKKARELFKDILPDQQEKH